MNILVGYRTYISAGIVIIHQIAKILGYDVPQESLSSAVDAFFGLATIFFRAKATTI